MKTKSNAKKDFTLEFLPVSSPVPTRGGDPVEMSGNSAIGKVAETIQVNIGDMAEKIGETLSVLIDKSLDKMDNMAPDIFAVKFTLGVTGSGNIVIGKFEASAGIEVVATWNGGKTK